MYRAANRKERARQVFNYLKDRFSSTTHPVRLELVDSLAEDPESGKQDFADSGWADKGRHLVIRINLFRCRDTSILIDTLLHEYAHCMDRWDWRSAEHPPHSHVWGCWYADIYTDFIDEGGWGRSKEYPVK